MPYQQHQNSLKSVILNKKKTLQSPNIFLSKKYNISQIGINSYSNTLPSVVLRDQVIIWLLVHYNSPHFTLIEEKDN